MAETEVESILREIRERVVSQQRAGQNTARSLANDAGNGTGESPAALEIARHENGGAANEENLAVVNSQLAITARAWDRLPPLLSNRSGFTARLELWLKRIFKRSSRWFTWEQVNFNAAVHHALRDLLPVLSAHEQELQKLRAQVTEAEARRKELELDQAALSAQLTAIQTSIDTQSQAAATQLQANFAALANELREHDQSRLDEQRVCFKQLALEASEAAVLEDRARRKTEALVEALQRRVDEREK
jgi:hypothetical protein